MSMVKKLSKRTLGYMVLLVVFAGILCACGSGESHVQATAQAERELAAQMTQALNAICEKTGPVPEAAAYSETSGIHPTVVLRGKPGVRWGIDDSYIHTEWKPQTLQDVELVACLNNEAVLIETCPYKLANGQAVSIERYQYLTTVTLYAAQTGEAITEMLWEGSLPNSCSTESWFKENETVKKLYGVATGGGEVSDWLQSYVELP